jgi:hypothetical protein
VPVECSIVHAVCSPTLIHEHMYETNNVLYPIYGLITYILCISYVDYKSYHTSILLCRDKEKALFVYSLTLWHCINVWGNEMSN